MKFHRFLSVATILVVASQSLLADSEFRFYGGVQNTKNLYKNNESIKAKSFELGYKAYENQNGWVLDSKLKYQDNDSVSFLDLELSTGYQLGKIDGYGVFRFIPFGFGYRYIKFDNMHGIYGTYDAADKLGSLYYKIGVEYQKNKLLIDKLNLTLGTYYQKTLYSSTWESDGYGGSSWGSSYGYEIDYKPKGLEISSELDYMITDKFSIGLKLGYSKMEDKIFINGTKLYLNDGFNLTTGIKYKF